MHWLHLISKLSDLFLQIYNTLILNQTRHSQSGLAGCLSWRVVFRNTTLQNSTGKLGLLYSTNDVIHIMILKISICSNRHYIGDWLWGTWSWVHVKAGGESLLWSPGQLAWAMVGQWCRLTSGPVHRWTLNNMTWETWDMLRWLIKSLSLNLTNKLRSSIHPIELVAAISILYVLMIQCEEEGEV